jgi:hypothetical protein
MRTTMMRLLLNLDPADGNGNGNGNLEPPAPRSDPNLAARLKAHKGDGVALAGEVYGQLQHALAVNAELRRKVPPEGAVVLSGDDAKSWQEFAGLGLKAKDVEAIVGEHKTLKADLARRARDDSLADAGYNAKTLGRLLPPDATIEVKDGEKGRDGKAAKLTTIKAGDGDAVPLSDWIARNLPDFPAGTFGGPDASAPGPNARPAEHRGAPPSPQPRRDAPPPPGSSRTNDDVAALAADLRVNVGYGGF